MGLVQEFTGWTWRVTHRQPIGDMWPPRTMESTASGPAQHCPRHAILVWAIHSLVRSQNFDTARGSIGCWWGRRTVRLRRIGSLRRAIEAPSPRPSAASGERTARGAVCQVEARLGRSTRWFDPRMSIKPGGAVGSRWGVEPCGCAAPARFDAPSRLHLRDRAQRGAGGQRGALSVRRRSVGRRPTLNKSSFEAMMKGRSTRSSAG